MSLEHAVISSNNIAEVLLVLSFEHVDSFAVERSEVTLGSEAET